MSTPQMNIKSYEPRHEKEWLTDQPDGSGSPVDAERPDGAGKGRGAGMSVIAPQMKITTAIPWFGTNRKNAAEPGRLAGKIDWLGVPCVGGGCELPHFDARTVLAGDLHRHLVNYLNVVADPQLNRELRRQVRRLPFAEETLAAAQEHCRQREAVVKVADGTLFGPDFAPIVLPSDESLTPSVAWARDYFVTAWMGRSASSGTDGEFDGGLPVRWNAGGGDSVVRYESAWRTLRAWGRAVQGTQFLVIDFFDFVARALAADRKEGEKRAAGKRPELRYLYVDLPWPDKGKTYRHKFTEAMQRRAAFELARFQHTGVIVRFGDHPMIRELYREALPDGTLPMGQWRWHRLTGRNQGNEDVQEVLILNGPAAARAAA